MKPFLTNRRRSMELLGLLLLDLIIYFIWSSWPMVTLFSLGFIWNWVASQDLQLLFENRRYRFSMLKMVMNLQFLFLKPFENFPAWVKWIVRTLPAGMFWSMVIFFNDSSMPWWATYLGSLVFEIIQLEITTFSKRHKEIQE